MDSKNSHRLFPKIRMALLIIFVFLFSIQAYAVDVRGRIDFQARFGIIPMNGAFVELCQVRRGCVGSRTGYDGMYYIRSDPGPHDVLVNGRLVFQVFIPTQRYFDIRPLLGN